MTDYLKIGLAYLAIILCMLCLAGSLLQMGAYADDHWIDPTPTPQPTDTTQIQPRQSAAPEVQPNTMESVDTSYGPFWTSHGDYTVTFYCACVKCCGKTDGITYTGALAEEGLTVAVDPDEIPLGTHLFIQGIGFRVAQDIGGAIQGNHIDVFVEDHQRALELGVMQAEVYTANEHRRDDP